MSEQIITMNEDILLSYWKEIFQDDDEAELALAEHYYVANFKLLAGLGQANSNLYYIDNIWRLNISKNLLENFVNASLVASILYLTGATNIPVSLATMILSAVCKFEKIEFLKSEEKIYINLPLKNHYATANDWYHALPLNMQKDINKLQFQDFMEKLVLAGLAKKDETNDDKYMVIKKGKRHFKIHFF
jgi:hypothetical protein